MKKESSIERDFVDRVRRLGCKAVKYEDPSERGNTDRIVLIPGGTAAFVEFKRHGEMPKDHQYRRMEEIRNMGFEVMWTDDAERGYQWIKSLKEKKGVSDEKKTIVSV